MILTDRRQNDPPVNVSDLPEGWGLATVSQIVKNFDWQRIPVKQDDRAKRGGVFPYYGASGIIDTIDAFLFDGDFLLIGEDGANLLMRSTPIAFLASGRFWVNNHAHVVQTRGDIPLPFLQHYFNSIDLEPFVTGSDQPKLTQTNMNRIPVPLPPLDEQERIVGKMERLLSQLTVAQDHLDKVPRIARRLRQSILAAACSGRLTEDWRRETRPVESGDDLLKDIQNDQQSCKVGRRKALDPLNGPELAGLPEAWAWARLGQLMTDGPQNGLYKPSTAYGEGMPIIRIDDYQDDFIRPRRDLLLIRLSAEEEARYGLHPNDIVINRVNSPSHIGKCLLVPEGLCPAVFESNMMRLAVSSRLDSAWIVLYLRSADGRKRLTADAKWAVNQVSINQTDVRNTAVPIPPFEEQREIVRRVAALFRLTDAVEKRVVAARLCTDKLTQSILARAFRGELVPTEAELARREGRSYEPASVLLERIRAESEKGKPQAKKKQSDVTARSRGSRQ